MQEITIRKIKEPFFSNNFEILDLGKLLLDKKMEEGLHRHDFFFFLILEEGDGKHHIDFIDFPVDSNSVYLIRPGQVHELLLNKRSKGFLITFDLTFYSPVNKIDKQVFWKVFQHNHFHFKKEVFKNILSNTKSILDEFIHKKTGYKETIHANLNILFIKLVREIEKRELSTLQEYLPAQKQLDLFIQLIDEEKCSSKSISEISGILKTTPYKLNTITKKLLGKTCSQYINEQLILEAKRLLLATSNQINEIAFMLCYEDPAYFIRFFKKHTGDTPQKFRQKFK